MAITEDTYKLPDVLTTFDKFKDEILTAVKEVNDESTDNAAALDRLTNLAEGVDGIQDAMQSVHDNLGTLKEAIAQKNAFITSQITKNQEADPAKQQQDEDLATKLLKGEAI